MSRKANVAVGGRKSAPLSAASARQPIPPAAPSAARPADPARPAAEPAASRRAVWGAALLIVFCVAAVYANCLSADFIFDDYHDIVENQAIRQSWPIWRAVIGSSGGKLTIHPRPVVALTFAANYRLLGMQAWQFHATNVAIHALAALVLFGIVRRTLLLPRAGDFAAAATPLALAIALLWGLHPLQTQAVTYIVQRYESLMGMFFLVALYAAIRAMTSPAAARWMILSTLAALLAMASKEVAVSLPLLVLLYDRTFVAGSLRRALRERWPLYAGLAGCWLAVLPLYLKFSGGGGLLPGQGRGFAGFAQQVRWYQYALTEPAVILHYLRLCVWPRGQCFDYGWPLVRSAAGALPALSVVLGLLAATAWCLVRRPGWGFLGAWFFLILAPTSSVMPIADRAFEHRMYLSSAAVLSGLVLGGYFLWRRWLAPALTGVRWGKWIPAAVAASGVLALGMQTMLRNEIYRSPVAVYQDAIENYPHSARAYLGLAVAYNLAGKPEAGLPAIERALALNPEQRHAHSTRAVLLSRLGRWDEALAEFALEERIDPDDPSTYAARGKCYFRLGRFAEAADQYTQAHQRAPQDGSHLSNRALCYEELGRHEAAIADCERAIALDPWLAPAYWHRGSSFVSLGQYDRAQADFAAALRLDPQLAYVHRERAAAYLATGQPERARAELDAFAAAGGKTDEEIERLWRRVKGAE